jgi:hypothetical protein
MKRFLLVILFGLCIVFNCPAQAARQTARFSISIDAGIPLSDYDSYYMTNVFKYGMGGSLKFDVPTPLNNFFVTISGGITTFYASAETSGRIDEVSEGLGAKSEDYAPLKCGLKYYFGCGFYGETQIGAVIHTGQSVPFFGEQAVSMLYSAGIGYSFSSGFEVDARYEQWNTGFDMGRLSQLGIRIAYSFKFSPHKR